MGDETLKADSPNNICFEKHDIMGIKAKYVNSNEKSLLRIFLDTILQTKKGTAIDKA